MKLISWNVNGLRACVTRGAFHPFFEQADADIFCVQECKMSADVPSLGLPGYLEFYNHAHKKGYSGTAMFVKKPPLSVAYGMGMEAHDGEGRMITLEYEGYYAVVIYTPNSQDGLRRLAYRMNWEDDMRAYLQDLDARKPVIFCGDLNVAHTKMDIKNATSNVKNPGFTPEEREKMTRLLDAGFIDTYRALHPDATDAYTWWSYFGNARARNVGWRIDYVCVSQRLRERVVSAEIHPEVLGSDHCPVELVIE